MKHHFLAIALIVVGIAVPVAVLADDAEDAFDVGLFRGWGPRLGMTLEPDQIHFGFHLDYGRPWNHLRFQPNAELGMGDGMTLFALNADAAYRLGTQWGRWNPYVGGGVGFHVRGANGLSDGDNGVGLSALAGLEKPMDSGGRLFFETKAGFAEAPDWKFTAGWTFAR
jgi:hypothetical protein